jgi:putative sigma-54 modulation protein
MKIEVLGKNYDVGDKLKEITAQKLSKLDKYFDGDQTKVKVCFKKQATSFTTEVMLDYTGKFVRATATGENFYDTLDVVLPKLEGQIRKHRTRFDKHSKNVAFKDASLYTSYDGDEKLKVVKEKKFKLTPMTVMEAVDELELLGHDFYVFLEVKTNTIQVLYKRNDGDLGLIEPEI